MTSDADDPHVIVTPAVPNLRDLGGRATADGGSVARGVVFRSAELATSEVADDPAVAELGLRTVVDLRTAAERDARPDRLPAGARGVAYDVMADFTPQGTGQVADLVRTAGALAAAPDGLDLLGAMRATYTNLVVAPSALAAYRGLVDAVLDGTPVLFHCTAGKDRTGWAATVLLLAAGVDEDGVLDEYLAVNPAVRGMFAPLLAQAEAVGGDPTILGPMLEVRPEYLEAAFDAVRDRFGSFDGYLADGLGLSPLQVEQLRRTLRDT